MGFVLLFVATTAFGQQAELSFDTNVDCNENTYCATINLKALETNEFKIGTSSIFMMYNQAALSFKSYESLNFDKGNLCIGNEYSAYDAHQYDAATPGIINTTMTLTVEDFACPVVDQAGINVAKVCFDVLEYGANSQLTFKARHTNFNRGQVEIELIEGVNMHNKQESIECSVTSTGAGSATTNVLIDVNPNPINDFINLEIDAAAGEEVSVTIFDVKGRAIKVVDQTINAGLNQVRIASDDLPQGVYLLDVKGADSSATMKLIKE